MLALVSFFTLIAIVLALTAGVLVDRSLRSEQSVTTRDQAVGTPFQAPTQTDPATTDPGVTDPPTTNPGVGTPGQPRTGNTPSSEEAEKIAGKVNPALVNINTELHYQGAAAAGTGMIISSDGRMLTNNHVIQGATTIRATVIGSGKTYTARVIGTSPTQDIALLQLVDAHGLPTVSLDTSATPKIGDPVVAAGNAGGLNGDPLVVSGSVTALNQTITATDETGRHSETLHGLIQTSAPIQAGDSGGPLINAESKVIGINTAASASNQFQPNNSVGYAIPVAHAMDIVRQIEAGRASSTIHLGYPGAMGITLGEAGSAQIQGVAPNSPADAAGMTAADTVTQIDGRQIATSQDITRAMAGKRKGDKISVTWINPYGESTTQTLTLMEGPAD